MEMANATATGSWVADIHAMHDKFGVHAAVAKMSNENRKTFLKFRLDFLLEELTETYKAAGYRLNVEAVADETLKRDSEEVVDGLIDLCVVAIGTLDVMNVDSQRAWNAVHAANMSKEVGVKSTRPNPLSLPDLVKPSGWQAPSHAGNHGFLTEMFATDSSVTVS